jgi:hypothetical protein
MEFGVKPGKPQIYAIPSSKLTDAIAVLDELESKWNEELDGFSKRYYSSRDKYHMDSEFDDWRNILSSQTEDLEFFFNKFGFKWFKRYEAFDSNEDLEHRMNDLSSKLLQEIVATADKVMATSIIKRANVKQGLTSKIRFPLISMSNKLKSWVSIRPEVKGAIDEIDAIVDTIPVPVGNKVSSEIPQGTSLYKSIVDLVTKMTSVDGVLGNKTSEEVDAEKAQTILDGLNATLEEQGEDTVSLPLPKTSPPIQPPEPVQANSSLKKLSELFPEENFPFEIAEIAEEEDEPVQASEPEPVQATMIVEDSTVKIIEQISKPSSYEDDFDEDDYEMEEQEVVATQNSQTRRRRALV